MSNKTKIRTLIREIVREEVGMAIKQVLTELKQPTQQVSQPQPTRKVVEKKQFSSNPLLNDILNETEGFDSNSGGIENMRASYGQMMNGQPTGDEVVSSMGTDPSRVDNATKNALTRDYSDLMKAIDNKKKGSPLKGRR